MKFGFFYILLKSIVNLFIYLLLYFWFLLPDFIRKFLFMIDLKISKILIPKLKKIKILRKIYIKITDVNFNQKTFRKLKIGSANNFKELSNTNLISFNEKKILIAKLDHIGDFLISLDILFQIRNNFPKAKIDIIVGTWNRELAENLKIFDNIYTKNYLSIGKNPKELFNIDEEYFHEKYDIFLNLRYGYDTNFLNNKINADKILCIESDISRIDNENNAIINFETPPTTKYKQNYYKLLKVAAPLLIRKKNYLNKDFFKLPNLNKFIRDNEEYIIISPTSNSALREFNQKLLDNLISFLFRETENKIIIVGKSNTKLDIKKFLSKSNGRLIDLVNKTNFQEFIALIKRSKIIFTANSSTAHFAALFKKKTLCFYFGTHSPLEWGPYNLNQTSIVSTINCAPCHLSEIDACPNNLKCKEFNENKIEKNLINFINANTHS